jgi:hypothetical protein
VRSTLELQPFSYAPAFRTYGPALDRSAYIARASLNVSLAANASVALDYGVSSRKTIRSTRAA